MKELQYDSFDEEKLRLIEQGIHSSSIGCYSRDLACKSSVLDPVSLLQAKHSFDLCHPHKYFEF